MSAIFSGEVVEHAEPLIEFRDTFEKAVILRELARVLDSINSTLAVAERYGPPSAIVKALVHAATHTYYNTILIQACPYFLGTSLKVEDYCDDVEMPGSRLNKVFFDPHYGDGGLRADVYNAVWGRR
jgi:hypothetical protein